MKSCFDLIDDPNMQSILTGDYPFHSTKCIPGFAQSILADKYTLLNGGCRLSWLERRVVVPEVGGSKPLIHPIFSLEDGKCT